MLYQRRVLNLFQFHHAKGLTFLQLVILVLLYMLQCLKVNFHKSACPLLIKHHCGCSFLLFAANSMDVRTVNTFELD